MKFFIVFLSAEVLPAASGLPQKSSFLIHVKPLKMFFAYLLHFEDLLMRDRKSRVVVESGKQKLLTVGRERQQCQSSSPDSEAEQTEEAVEMPTLLASKVPVQKDAVWGVCQPISIGSTSTLGLLEVWAWGLWFAGLGGSWLVFGCIFCGARVSEGCAVAAPGY